MSKQERDGIILDTHTWIWLFNGSQELSPKTIEEINKWGKQGEVFISAISIWELSMLVSKERVLLTRPLKQWVEDSLNQPGVHLAPLSPQIAIESSFLPEKFHGDPADRIICATARIKNLILFTKDKKIIDYGKKGFVTCHQV